MTAQLQLSGFEALMCITIERRKQSQSAVQWELEGLASFSTWLKVVALGLYGALDTGKSIAEPDVGMLVRRALRDAPSPAEFERWRRFLLDIAFIGEQNWGWKGAVQQVSRALPKEKAIWSSSDIKSLHACDAWRTELYRQLGNACLAPSSLDSGLGLVVLMLESGVTRLDDLLTLISPKKSRITCLDESIYASVEQEGEAFKRWSLSAIGGFVLIRLQHQYRSQSKAVIQRRIHQALAFISPQAGMGPRSWRALVDMIQLSWRVDRSALVQAVAAGDHSITPLTESAWTRSMLGRYESVRAVRRTRQTYQPSNKPASVAKQLKLLKSVRSRINRPNKRTQLLKRLKSEALDELGSAAQLLYQWALHMIEFGGQIKDKLRDSTIYSYLEIIALVMDEWGDLDLFEWDEEMMTRQAQLLFGKAHSDNQREFLSYWYLFVNEQDLLAEIDLGWLPKKWAVSRVDSNYVTPAELDRALNWLEAQPIDPEQRLGAQVAAILGYYAMLRRGEVTRLRLQDCVLGPFPEIRVMNTAEGKTKNGKARRVSLVMPESHKARIAQYIELYRSEAPKSESLLSSGELSCGQRQWRYLVWASDAIRTETQDQTVRYHHLRHSGATNLILSGAILFWRGGKCLEGCPVLFNHPVFEERYIEQQWLYLLGQQDVEAADPSGFLYRIANLLGHASPHTTLQHYFHFPELLIELAEPQTQWLPERLCRTLLNYDAKQTGYFEQVDDFKAVAELRKQHSGGEVFNERSVFSRSLTERVIKRSTSLASCGVEPVCGELSGLSGHQLNPKRVCDYPWLIRRSSQELLDPSVISEWSETQLQAAQFGLAYFQRWRRAPLETLEKRLRNAVETLVAPDCSKVSWRVASLREAKRWTCLIEGLGMPRSAWRWEIVSEKGVRASRPDVLAEMVASLPGEPNHQSRSQVKASGTLKLCLGREAGECNPTLQALRMLLVWVRSNPS